MNGKIIVTKCGRYIITLLYDGCHVVDIDVEDGDNKSDIGSIYVGRVMDIVKNINAAFIEYKSGVKGYFSISENPEPIYLNNKNNGRLCQGDQILVRLSKEAIKTKDPVLSSKLELAGKYVVLTTGDTRISFSGKFNDSIKKIKIKESINSKNYRDIGFIIRTNALDAEIEKILDEAEALTVQYRNIISKASYRVSGTKLYETPDSYSLYVRDVYSGLAEEVVTDEPDIYRRLINEFPDKSVRMYEDNMLPLKKLYNIDGLIEELLKKKVWLKSGAYLVIEPTEALTVIDVNTGKCIKGRSNDEVFFKVNKEAAWEIARQIRLRNLSGIIVVDFINMSDEEFRISLLNELKKAISSDHIKTSVVDMTKLGLVEITRKKVKPPLHQVFECLKCKNGE